MFRIHPRTLLKAALLPTALLLAAGGSPQPVAPGLPDSGPVTGWGLPVVRLVFDLSAVWVIGALVTALLLPAAGYIGNAAPTLRAAGWGVVTT